MSITLRLLSERYGSTMIVDFQSEEDVDEYIHKHDPDGHYCWTYATEEHGVKMLANTPCSPITGALTYVDKRIIQLSLEEKMASLGTDMVGHQRIKKILTKVEGMA
jgi:hypothetical protein